jgi:hypothetical protein
MKSNLLLIKNDPQRYIVNAVNRLIDDFDHEDHGDFIVDLLLVNMINYFNNCEDEKLYIVSLKLHEALLWYNEFVDQYDDKTDVQEPKTDLDE